MNWRLVYGYVRKRIIQFFHDDQLYLRFFALFLAIVLWFLAGGEERFPPTERVLTVPVQVQAMPENIALVDEPPSVRVRIRALSPLISLAERELQAVVNLGAAIEGEGTYGVEVIAPSGVDVVSVTPRWIPLRTELILEEVFPVTVALVGLPPEQGIQSLVPEPSTVLVRAPRSVLEEVRQVVAFIALGGATSRLEGNFPVRATDTQGRALDNVEIEPEQVRVILQQVVQEIQLDVPVIPQFEGDLRQGLGLDQVAVEPDQIEVLVPGRQVTEVEQFVTEPVSLTNLEPGEYSFEVDVIIPSGTQPLRAPTVVLNMAVVESPDDLLDAAEPDPEQVETDQPEESQEEPEQSKEEPEELPEPQGELEDPANDGMNENREDDVNG